MTVTDETIDARTHAISVEGELVGSVGHSLIAAAESRAQAGATRVIVDLTGMTFLDSGGLAALLGAWQLLVKSKIRIALVIPAGAYVMRTLETRGVHELFTIVPTRDAALAELNAR